MAAILAESGRRTVGEERQAGPRRWRAVCLRPGGAAIGGVLLYLSFAPRDWWWLAPLAIACLGLVLDGRRFRSGCGYGAVFGLGVFLPQLVWIQDFLGSSFGPSPWLGLAAVSAVFVALACGLITVVAQLPAAPVWMAVVFLLQEFARTWWPFGGFPWGKVAFSQPDGVFTSLASLGGVPLVGMAVLVTGFGLAQLLLRVRRGGRQLSARRWVAPALAVLIPAVAGIAVWPTVGTQPQAGALTVAAVQGNAPNIGLGLLSARGELRANHLAESRRLLAEIRAGRTPQPDLVIWPETATALTGGDATLDALSDAFGAPMLIGARVVLPDGTPQNVMVQWEPGVGPTTRYAKQQLVPFAEYIPLRSIAGWFTPFAAGTVDMQPGATPGVFRVAGTSIGTAICYEVGYDYVFRQEVNAGAQLLVLPTNTAWFGRSEMSYQQLAMARLRAVEHSRAVVVAATSGVSAIVRPDGTVERSTSLFTAESLVAEVPLRTETTVADRLGAWVQNLLIAMAALALAGSVMRRRGRRPNVS